MTDTTNRPTVTQHGLLTAAIAFPLPFIADKLITAAMVDAGEGSFGTLLGNAVYAALPFLLLDSAMRPRKRVRMALWLGCALTIVVWAMFALTGRAAQLDASAGNAHLGLFMITMVWPMVVVILMGLAAKVGEKPDVA